MSSEQFDHYACDELKAIVKQLESGKFGHPEQHRDILNTIRNQNDHYLVGHDFKSYIEA